MSTDAEAVAGRLIEAFGAIDFDGMRAKLGDDLRAHITNAEGMVEALPAESDVFWSADAAE
jgi:hypothetical protein